MGLDGWGLLGQKLLEVLGVRAYLASPWMPEAPRDRHWALSLSMVMSTVSIMDANEQLQVLSRPATELGDTTQPKQSSPYHSTWPACVLEPCWWSSREVCASCLAQLLLGSMALGTGRCPAVTL